MIKKEYTDEILSSEYFDIHTHYKNIYGENVVVLIQIGSFHECYATDTLGVTNIQQLAENLGVIVTKKNKKKELDKTNSYMIGYPIYKIYDFIESLINLNYTVIVIDQVSEPPKPKRKITGIYSPATFVEKSLSRNKNTNLVCIILDSVKNNNSKYLLSIGLASYDLTTGKGYVYETVSKLNDELFALDDAIRFLENNPSEEIIFHCTRKTKKILQNEKIADMKLDDIMAYLSITKNIFSLHNFEMISSPNYQLKLLSKIYSSNFIDDNDLIYYNLARLALCGLLAYTEEHQKCLLNNLQNPVFFSNSNKLFLGNRALEQLNVINNENSLFSIVDFTKNIIGKRFLKDSLINPITDTIELNKRYKQIDIFKTNDINTVISSDLKKIYDLHKLIRRIELKKISPCEFYNLYGSLKSIDNIFDSCIKNIIDIHPEYITDIKEFLIYTEHLFDLDYIINVNFINYKEEEYNFFKEKYKDLDEICETIKLSNNFFEYLCKELEKYIEDKKFMKKDKSYIHIKQNDRDGHYLLISSRRCKLLKEKLQKIKEISIGNKIIKYTDLTFINLNNNVKIQCDTMKNISSNVFEIKQQLASKIKVTFYEEMDYIKNNFLKNIQSIIQLIGYIDFINSGAIGSEKLGYFKPEINEYENSFLEAEELRHPIVETINDNTIYQPHNISLGKDKFGILLFGINSSGKSTLMKSIGLCVILAQIGYYVPAKSFTYKPYTNLFTRIIGNDDMFKGLSSFMIEMLELIAILKRNNNSTLVLGDEICRGTEEKSANIIVAYMLEKLANSKTSFISATHLHQICDLECVKNLSKIKIMHLKVDYDNTNDTLIYNRELSSGQGNKYYGVLVAKYLMKDDNFNIRTKQIENEFDNINVKKSNYNSNIWMIECHICKNKKNLETHHINFQKDCNENIVIDKPHIKKNKAHNLVILCSTCHDKVDRNEIVINGWKDTSNGILLDYTSSKKKTKKKFTELDINIIKSYINKKLTLVQTKNILENKNNIKISTNLISKIWNNKY